MTARRRFRRAAVAIGGGLLVLLGILGSALPVLPGMVFLVAGLLLWSTEFRWAKQLLTRLRQWIGDRAGAGRYLRGLGFRSRPHRAGEEEGD